MELTKRKPLRLKEHDYNEAGCYFSTFCTHEMKMLLGHITGVGAIHESPVVQLSPIGQILDQVIQSVPARFSTVSVDKYIIMPNHVHLILRFHPEIPQRAIHESPLRPRSLYSQVIGYLKATATKQVRRTIDSDLILWQRGSYDHIIRNDADFQRIWTYIDTNPLKWEEDIYYHRGT